MKFIVDTVDLNEIREANEYLPLAGVTCNPSIVSKSNTTDFFGRMKEIRSIIGRDKQLHMQVISRDAQGMLKEADRLTSEIDKDIYIKVPASLEGIKAMKLMKGKGYKVTATAVYSLMQAYLSYAAKADCIVPYVNRIINLGNDPYYIIKNLAARIEKEGSESEILCASIKNTQQIEECFNNGCDSITLPYSILKQVFADPSIEKAVDDFTNDWEKLFGKGNDLTKL